MNEKLDNHGLTYTDHFLQRMQERGISERKIIRTICHAKNHPQGKIKTHFVYGKEHKKLTLKGTTVIVDLDNRLITCWSEPQ